MENSLGRSAFTQKKNMFFFSAFVCVAIPGFAAVKALVIVGLWIYMVSTCPLKTRSILWFLSVVLNVVFCCEVAFLHNVPTADTTNQLSRILLFFLVLGSAAFIADAGSFNLMSTDRLILAISLISVLLKIAIMAALLSGKASLEAIQSGLGFETVTDDIGFGLQRLQFPSDIAVVFLIACYTGGRRKLIDLLFLVAVTADVFLSFSRFLFGAYVACLVIRYWRVRKFDQVSAVAVFVALLLGTIFSVSLVSRFSTQRTEASDSTRTEQIKNLSEVIVQYPLLGTGVGSSVNGYKRSVTMPFSYEVQWYAIVMQLGFVGLAWFLANMLSPLSRCFNAHVRSGIFLSVFLIWVLAGFTNPLIISLGSAFGLSILMLVITKDEVKARPWRRFPAQNKGVSREPEGC
jgi:hypothetical protein